MNRPLKVKGLRVAQRTLAVLALAVLAGCAAVGPNYIPPQTPVSTTWNTPLQGGITVETEPRNLADWWTTLNDPELSRLIERAAAGNLDLKKATARIREARARRGLSKAGLYPTLDASGSATRSRGSADMGPVATTDLFSAGLDASWEIDLFGGVRRSVEAADADLQAAGEDLRDTLVSLLAEVALNYVDLRTAQARLAVTETSLKSLEETYRLAKWRSQAGLGDELAVEQARYNLESARSQIPTLLTAIAEAQNRLAVLLGEAPGAVHAELSKPEPLPSLPPEVAIGVPADLLRQRPDVRRAERQLAAQTARIGVATAELYPKLKLSGAIGLQALSFNGLFNVGERHLQRLFRSHLAGLRRRRDPEEHRDPVRPAGAVTDRLRVRRARCPGGGGKRDHGLCPGTAAPAVARRGGPVGGGGGRTCRNQVPRGADRFYDGAGGRAVAPELPGPARPERRGHRHESGQTLQGPGRRVDRVHPG